MSNDNTLIMATKDNSSPGLKRDDEIQIQNMRPRNRGLVLPQIINSARAGLMGILQSRPEEILDIEEI